MWNNKNSNRYRNCNNYCRNNSNKNSFNFFRECLLPSPTGKFPTSQTSTIIPYMRIYPLSNWLLSIKILSVCLFTNICILSIRQILVLPIWINSVCIWHRSVWLIRILMRKVLSIRIWNICLLTICKVSVMGRSIWHNAIRVLPKLILHGRTLPIQTRMMSTCGIIIYPLFVWNIRIHRPLRNIWASKILRATILRHSIFLIPILRNIILSVSIWRKVIHLTFLLSILTH